MAGAATRTGEPTKSHDAGKDAAWLAAIVSSSDDAIVSKDLNGVVSTWNGAAERIFGYAADEMIGRSIKTIVPPELHFEEDTILETLRRGERVEHFDTTRVTKDGRRIAVSLTVSPVRDASGSIIGASKVARDVTERKRVEQVRDLLIDELNHRVKNSLATVQLIAAQTFAGLPGARERLQILDKRIASLAVSQELLTANEWRGVQLQDLIKAVLFPFLDGGSRIDLDPGKSVLLSPRETNALAMALHELATNAAKYGALSQESGRISIGWQGDPEDGGVALSWRESGGPPVTAPERTGFGMHVITQALRHDLRADADLSFAREGVQFHALFRRS